MENSEVEAIVAKSGETCIQTSIGRSTDGLMINVWAQPKVEDFIRLLGNGEKIDVQTIGRFWTPSRKDKEKQIMVYDYALELPRNDIINFRLDRPGLPILDIGDDPPIVYPERDREGRLFAIPKGVKTNHPGTLNLSFLRCVGISEPGGVTFKIKGVYERSSVDRLGIKIENALKVFYREFIKPYRLIVTVSTMAIPPSSESGF